MAKYIITFFMIFFPVWSFSQETNQSEKLSEIIISVAEELAADDSDPEAAATYIERLYELAENPVKINSAGENEISRLFFLSDFQAKALADYAHSSGRIISVYELVNIPGFDKETAEMMIPFITLDSKTTVNSDSVHWRNTSITNLSIRSGNDDTTSLGSPWKILTKYKFTAGGFSGGFTAEKDPGEKFFSANPPLPDFLSANLTYNGSGLIRRLIVGDYSARFGQGTNINTGIRTDLSLTAPGYMSASDEIKPYTSTDENNFFRGVAAEFSYENLGLTLFYSKNYSDATLGSLSGSSKDYIENFYLAGIHNTSSLLQKKDAISELAYGINLSYNFNNLRIGFTWSGDRFSLPVKMTGNDPVDIFDFEGDRNNLYTFSYNGLIKRILLYGEFSTNEYKKYALVQGLSFRPSDRLTINFLFRNYSTGYISFHGKGPGGGSANGNEQGILGNFTFEAAKHLFISGGCDIQQFQWLKYRCSSPSSAMRQEIRVRFTPTETLTIDASYNNRSSMFNKQESMGIPGQVELESRTVKVSAKYTFSDNLTLATRLDYKVVDPSGSKGILLLQDMVYRFRQLPVTLWFRYCIFQTDDWDSRLYTYENDLLYSFSIPALSGEGSRSYIMVKWEVSDIAELRVKYGLTSLIESGTSTKNNKELKIQFKIQF
ncbi:MAG: helix-hairpin-helix domain-containing protein [Bacteroidia bacterium]|nr:helix-hairpin-helix domain-containing protein [Bacteroidia bacterium]